MADTEKELLEQALSEPVEPPAEPQEAAAPEAAAPPPAEGQPRDPATGKFRPKAGEPPAVEAAPIAPETPAQPERREDHRIPLSEHLSEREKRQNAERERDDFRRQMDALNRRIAELSRPQPEPAAPPDPYADPSGFMQHGIRQAVDPIQERIDDVRDQFSRMFAEREHGAELVQEAMSEFERELASNPASRFEAQRIWRSPNPYGELVARHKSRKALAEIGTDPAAYRTKLQDDLLKDPAFLARAIEAAKATAVQPAANGSRPLNVSLPPSLNRTPGSGGLSPTAAPQSDKEIFEGLFPK